MHWLLLVCPCKSLSGQRLVLYALSGRSIALRRRGFDGAATKSGDAGTQPPSRANANESVEVDELSGLLDDEVNALQVQ